MKRIIMKNKTIELCIIRGVEGDCVVLNDYRIAGSKHRYRAHKRSPESNKVKCLI